MAASFGIYKVLLDERRYVVWRIPRNSNGRLIPLLANSITLFAEIYSLCSVVLEQ